MITITAEVIGAAVVPGLILIARIVEISLETVRTIYVTRGHADLASYIGITKTGIWLLSTGLVLTNLLDYWSVLAYLAGYGIGTRIGIEIEQWISIGYVIVRIITSADPRPVAKRLSGLGYGMTRIEGSGSFANSVTILFMIVPRTELGRLLGIISDEYPELLYTTEDIRSLNDGARIFHKDARSRILGFFGL